jgi:hypothetical protein
MENIIQPNEQFDFSKLTLAHPTGIQGGAYFTKIEYNNKPLYIQTNKILTRNGFVKTGKKYYCDLMFDNNSGEIINWFENLEENCQKLIYAKSETWFQDALEMTDVESAFNSVIRVYRSGKFYLVRVNVKNSPITHEPVINIYDENESPLTLKDITPDTNIISILEIQGIKFTSRNFQIEIEIKQVMALSSEPIFESCLIKKDKNNTLLTNNDTNVVEHLEEQNKKELITTSNEILSAELQDLTKIERETHQQTHSEDIFNEPLNSLEQVDINANNYIQQLFDKDPSLAIEIEELKLEDLEEPKELKEFDLEFGLENNLETFKLKRRNQVYEDLYKDARKKAKNAKKMAILAYLEAKNIKKTYMIENLNDSDSDFDAEIEEVSESELEGL